MNMRMWSIGLLVTVTAVAGCSRRDRDPPAAHAAPDTTAYVAVARGRIAVEGGLLKLSMPVAGTLASVAVHEGDHVSRGQALATLDSGPAQAALDMAKAELDQAKATQKLLSVQWKAAQQQAQRETAAAAAGAGSGQSADAAKSSVAQLDAKRDAARAATAIARARVDAAQYTLAHDTLRAPIDADVVHVMAQPGATVSADSGPLFTLLPARRRIVRAELSASYVDAVHIGMHAQVNLDDSQGTPIGSAQVLRIGEVFSPATLGADPETRANARTVECVLSLDKKTRLRIGQRVLVSFLPGKGTAKG